MSDTLQVPRIELADGRHMPQLGYGVWQVADEIAADMVGIAIDAGYRSIDTATIYDNERGVGEGVRRTDVPRDELFITTKLWNSDQGRDAALRAFEASLERLGLDEVDLYLIHWPSPGRALYEESWSTLVELREQGRASSIGVSNFKPEHLERIIESTGEVPAVNQVELHPYFQQSELRQVHERLGIATEAWSPIGQGGPLLADPVVTRTAGEHGVTPAQVVLRWHLQLGTVAIPKSATPSRIAENIDLFGFELDASDMHAIGALDRGEAGRIGPDPATAAF